MAFYGKVALVTGAGSGMGRLSARRLAAAGAQVAALDVNEEGLAETARLWDNIHIYRCDVTDRDRVAQIVTEVETELGPIDRVTHAAAIMPAAPIADMDIGLIHKLMDINFGGTVNIVKAALPSMLERRQGEFVLFGSLAGEVPTPHLGVYNATKAAVNMFTEVLIKENEGSGLRFLLVCPPMVNTPLLEQATKSSNPRSVQLGIEQGRPADPNWVLDQIEESLDKGETILFPGMEAKILHGLRRYSPKLLWWLVMKAENS